MFVLVSPTKTQKAHKGESTTDSLFTDKANTILNVLKSYSEETLKEYMRISDKIAHNVYTNFQNYNEDNVAIQTYQGASFKAMETDSWTEIDKQFANQNLRILSALYGVLQPFDLIGLYRLDFLNAFDFNLYDFWRDTITEYFNSMNTPIINLASKEYSKMINEDALSVPIIKVDFKEQVDDTFITKSTYAKIARGTMTKLLIQKQVKNIEDVKAISFDQYHYNASLSNDKEFIFTR